MFNNFIVSGNYSDISKIAKVTPIHKNGSKTELRNLFLFATVQQNFGNDFEHRLIQFWNKYGTLASTQSGVRKNLRRSLLTYVKTF